MPSSIIAYDPNQKNLVHLVNQNIMPALAETTDVPT
jgi:hypothetical protein